MYLFFILFFINVLAADYGAGYAGSAFRYGSNAREFSLSGALISDNTPGFYSFSNPALLKYSKDTHIGVSIQKMSLDRSIQSFCFSQQLPPYAGISLSAIQAGTNKIMGKSGTNEFTEYFSSRETQAIISFGVSLGSKFGVGINVKALFNTIYNDYKGNGISIDFGLIYKLNRHLIIGALTKNINTRYNWKVTIGSDERTYEEKIPLIHAIGFYYSGIKKINLFFQQDIIIIHNDYVNYRSRIGIEYRLNNNINIRGGLKQALGSNLQDVNYNRLNLKPTLGLGLPLKVWHKRYIRMDYALDPGSVGEGLSHLFSFSIKY